MARTGTAEKHREAHANFAAAVVPLVARAWENLLDPHDLKGSQSRLVVAIQAIVAKYGRASAAAGLTYYRNERRAAGIVGRARLPMPPLPSADQIAATVGHVLSPMYGPTDAAVEQNAHDALASEVEQMVLDQSRLAVIGAAEVDKEAKGWARVTEPGACSFCRLLATRGAVYKSKTAADFRAHTVKPDGSGGTCRCHAEPEFHNFEPAAQARQDTIDYQRLADEYGHSGRDILIAWRQHVEGREVTGPKTRPYTHTK